ncbi:penicillin-binding protein 2 [Patescibacteria group bacterium]|nr:penicillin-binding protein 2 [Patescibacteria group bacterium]MBU1895810.1 penicillin-binding protein 2 [Patescibacteria group bacterium]
MASDQALHNVTRRKRNDTASPRLRFAAVVVFFVGGLIISRLFTLMILQHSFYTALAAGSHEVYAQLFPVRGEIFVQDSRTGEEYPLAINRDYFLIYADTRLILDDEMAENVAEKLAEVFEYNDEKKLEVFLQVNKRTDPYEPLEMKVDQEVVDKLTELDLPGINYIRQSHRFYPENNLASHVVGFVGKTEDGQNIGRYGVEGYWQDELAGSGGFYEGMKSATGLWIPLAGKNLESAKDGVDILLTIDRTLQFKACQKLNFAAIEYGAVSASLVILDPWTGAIRTMCGFPDFDPNDYSQVESGEVYNNNSIFMSYEPGSIFKPVVMAAALNEGVVTPNTWFTDTGIRDDICDTPIRNAESKIFGNQTMTGVLENSINTGMVFVAEQLGKKKLINYIEDFGFGLKEGIELDSENSGTIDTLSINRGDNVDCYSATASFGQGITATPLQLVTAFGAIANGGTLLKPYIVEEIRYADGKVDRFGKKEVRQVIQKKSANLLGGMLVTVVDSGHATGAGVEGYYVAGKTGTAQIAGSGGYTDATNQSFVGFAPVDNAKFVMIVKFEKPKRAYSATTAAPVFGDIASFVLQYYQVPPGR